LNCADAGSLDSLAGEVAQRALELRGAADKGARSRKKKALTDLLQALAAAGLSKQRSAVPSAERSVHSWFTQVHAHPLHMASALASCGRCHTHGICCVSEVRCKRSSG
jgi:hypothetical protein